MFNALAGLPRTVWLIGLISLVNDSASEMLYPLMPLYLASVLMSGPKVLGLIEGIAEATASLLKLFSGVIVDRTRRSKIWIVLGYGPASLGRPLIAFVSSWPWLLLIRFTDRVGKGLRTSPRDALLAASVRADQHGLVYGLHRAMDNAGSVIGPLIAALLLGMQMSLQDIFLWSALPSLLCLLLALMIREPEPARAADREHRFDWRLGDMPPVFRRYLLVMALFTLGNSSNMFLLLRAGEMGVKPAEIPLLWAAVSLVATVLSTPLSALSDRVGRVRMLMAGYLAYALFYLGMGMISHDGWVMFALFGFYGVFVAATEGVEKALVADIAPAGRRGTAFGWFNLTAGAFLLPASIVFGWLYEGFSPVVAFVWSGSCALLATVLLGVWVGPAKVKALRQQLLAAEQASSAVTVPSADTVPSVDTVPSAATAQSERDSKVSSPDGNLS
ncbi:MFS transporter [Pokkaliibacter plantistimulans]|uniref:MFS transporter n=1 Tax=Proteobacteria bacterium 228 TaxID=2083153 RepID=A0A2S5KPY5_9PROT|nr:MFS transporter [Pokkaliibacter plantistimulans]PPC76609.1 MFS transporter [Pokkaliibacter plantistimulans]